MHVVHSLDSEADFGEYDDDDYDDADIGAEKSVVGVPSFSCGPPWWLKNHISPIFRHCPHQKPDTDMDLHTELELGSRTREV